MIGLALIYLGIGIAAHLFIVAVVAFITWLINNLL